MKNFKKLFALAIAVILLAGCGMKESFNLKVTSDKKVSFEVKILMDNEMIDTMLSMGDGSGSLTDDDTEKTFTDSERWEYLEENMNCEDEEGYTCEKVTEGNYKGMLLKTNSKDIDEFVGTGSKINLAQLSELSGKALFTKSGDVYSSNFEYLVDSTNQMNQYSSQMDMFKIEFSVTLPNASISNNADTVSSDGLTLSWDLAEGTSKTIDFSFKFDSSAKPSTTEPTKKTDTTTTTTTTDDNKVVSNKSEGMSTTTLILIIVCSVLGLALISIIIILLARKSNKKPIQPAPVSNTAAEFKNPELANHREPTPAPTESDTVNVSEMTQTEETNANKEE